MTIKNHRKSKTNNRTQNRKMIRVYRTCENVFCLQNSILRQLKNVTFQVTRHYFDEWRIHSFEVNWMPNCVRNIEIGYVIRHQFTLAHFRVDSSEKQKKLWHVNIFPQQMTSGILRCLHIYYKCFIVNERNWLWNIIIIKKCSLFLASFIEFLVNFKMIYGVWCGW